MAVINLLPEQYLGRQQAARLRLKVVVGALLLSLLPVALYGSSLLVIYHERRLQARAEAAYLTYMPGLQLQSQVASLQQQLAKKRAAVAALEPKVQWAPTLRDFAFITPRTVSLQTLATSAQGIVTITGVAGSVDVVAELLHAINRSPYLENAVAHVIQNTNGTYSFTLTCQLRPQPASAVGGGS